MEHSYIEEHNIADRYLLGKLSAEDRTRFEEHFVDCARCLDQLETAEGFRAGLQTIAAEELSRSRAHFQARLAGLLALVARMSRARRAGLMAGIMLLIALPMLWLTLEWRGTRRDLAEARQAVSEWQRRYEDREQASRELMKEAETREQNASETRDQLAAQLERERKDRHPSEKTGEGTGARAVVPVFAMSLLRGSAPDLSQPTNRIAIPRTADSIVLLFELDPNPDLQSYSATITRADGRSIWRGSNLKPSSEETLALSFNSGLFKADNYLLTLEGLTVQGHTVPVARYTFRVIMQ